MPVGQKVAYFLEHIFRKVVGVRTAPNFLELFEFSDQMGPAKLSEAFVISPVSRVIVAGDDSLEGIAENRGKDFSAPAGSNAEVDHQRRNKDPKVEALPFRLPTGFVNIEGRRLGQGLPDLLDNRLELGADPVNDVTDRSKRDIQIEQSSHDFDHTPTGSQML